STPLVRADFLGNRPVVLRAVRSAAEDAFSHLSQPALPVAFPAFWLAAFPAASARFSRGILFSGTAALARGEGIHGPLVWKSRGITPGDAGVGPGIFVRGAEHDQPGARPSGRDRTPGDETARPDDH